MQKTVNQQHLAWLCSSNILTVENFLEFANELQKNSDFGTIQNPSITLSNGVLPIQLTGDPKQVISEFEQITDKRFTNANFKCVFPNSNNLTITVSCNFAFGHVTTIIQNGTNEAAEKIFSLVTEAFPRSAGPSDQEIEQRSLQLAQLIKEAKKAAQASDESQKNSSVAEKHQKKAEEISSKLQEIHKDSNNFLKEIKEFLNTSSQKSSGISNFHTQSKSANENIEKLRDDTGAIEAQIREFFNEVAETKKAITQAKNLSNETVTSNNNKTEEIIKRNKELQDEVKEHLLKAVGASLFSAFEKRKERIEISKWVWAGFTTIAIIAQIFVIRWIAVHAGNLPSDISFYKTPSFLLRVSVSIPILFFIGYSIQQYAREREYEELYGFKSSLSFSLSPYLDLVRELNKNPKEVNDEYRQFAIETIRQIFDNPLPLATGKKSKDQVDYNVIKDVSEQIVKLIEKRK